MSIQLSQGIIAICMLVITVGTLAVSIVLVMLVMKLRRSVVILSNKAQPLISQATDTVKTVNGAAQSVKTHIDNIMDTAEDTVDSVSSKVRTTTSVIQQTINPSVVTVASLLTGVTRGLEVWSQIKKRGGNGHARS